MSPARRSHFRYDVFVSYSHRNKDWVREWLVPQMQNAGLTVCIDHESFEPGAPSITEMERAVLQSRKTVLVLTPEYLQSEWTAFESILGQTLDPSADQRRFLPVLLVQCELPLRFRVLTCLDFTHAVTHAETVERLVAAIRRRAVASRMARPVKAAPLPFAVPTGALSPDSPLYIERSHDQHLRQQVTFNGSTTIVEGARQMGKTSLLARAVAQARTQQYTIVDFHFQLLDEEDLATLDTLLRYLANALFERLQLAVTPQALWRGPRGAKEKLTSFIYDYVLQGRRLPVVVVTDEVDRVFGRPYQSDFFGLLRFWHDQRAFDPRWEKLNLVLACSTDPHQAIKDPHQSPFNVGNRIQLRDFSADNIWELNQRYGRPLPRKAQVQALIDVIDGHPCLAQQALYALAARTHTLSGLLNTDNADAGPFADHLQHYRCLLEPDPLLQQGMRQVLSHGTCADYGTFVQLRSLGLVTGDSHHDVRPRCRLYAAYFQRVLT